MEKIFFPESIVIVGLSARPNNMSRMILENLLRWGYEGKIFGLNPISDDAHVDGVKMYKHIEELPEVPDIAVTLIPARFIPQQMESLGKFGVKRMAISSGGFGEFSEEGKSLADKVVGVARKYGIRFVGPNGLTVANTANGLCLPFVPLYRPPIGKISVISQSGGVGIILWNLIAGEHLGMAKFASIGNKLDLDEVDFLEYFGQDRDTKCIFMYLESISRGKELIEAASKIDKPVIVLKSNTTSAGTKAAMSHTAALSNNDEIIDAAFEKAGIIRIHRYRDFISTAKAWKLPPMKGNRVMVVTPAGGFSVICADLVEKSSFEFADPGKDFYDGLQKFSNAGVIKFSNPLDVGDIYDEKLTGHVFFSVLHNKNVDGLIYISQWPNMPIGDDVFSRMFRTDLSKETWGAILSSGKPVWLCLFGPSESMAAVKMNANFPIFDSPEEMIKAMQLQRDYYVKKDAGLIVAERPAGIDQSSADGWVSDHQGISGEDSLDLLSRYGIATAQSTVAKDEPSAVTGAGEIGYPVVMKVVSPDAIHKTEAKGVIVDIKDEAEAQKAFQSIKKNLEAYKPGADFQGVRIQHMAGDGYDMFIGGKYDECFGPVVYFGFGGVYVEIFKDVGIALCPGSSIEIEAKVKKLKAYGLIKGARGQQAGDVAGYIDTIVRISHLMADFPQIKELDINPLRILADGSGVMALDARVRIG